MVSVFISGKNSILIKYLRKKLINLRVCFFLLMLIGVAIAVILVFIYVVVFKRTKGKNNNARLRKERKNNTRSVRVFAKPYPLVPYSLGEGVREAPPKRSGGGSTPPPPDRRSPRFAYTSPGRFSIRSPKTPLTI